MVSGEYVRWFVSWLFLDFVQVAFDRVKSVLVLSRFGVYLLVQIKVYS